MHIINANVTFIISVIYNYCRKSYTCTLDTLLENVDSTSGYRRHSTSIGYRHRSQYHKKGKYILTVVDGHLRMLNILHRSS